MIVKNLESRIIILGDRVRVGKNPGRGTRLNPGGEVDSDDVSDLQRPRFLDAVKRAIEKGVRLEVVAESGLSLAQVEDAARKSVVAKASEMLDAEKSAPKREKSDGETKRGPGRPRKGE